MCLKLQVTQTGTELVGQSALFFNQIARIIYHEYLWKDSVNILDLSRSGNLTKLMILKIERAQAFFKMSFGHLMGAVRLKRD